MTVRDLVIAGGSELTDMEVIIRDKGKWVHGWRIGPHAKLYRYEHCAEFQHLRNQFGYGVVYLEPGQIAEVKEASAQLPKTIMCLKPKEAPKEVLDLKVNYYQPRHIPEFHKEQLTHNDFALEIVCFPPDQEVDVITAKIKAAMNKQDEIEGQMSLDQFFSTEKI